jgi:hypothetical protein
MRGYLTVLALAIVAVGAGLLGFQAGVLSNIGASGGSVVWYAGGPGFGGFLLFFLFIALLLFAFGGRRRGPWGGPGRWGPGYGPMSGGDPRREWIADAHRRLHEEEAQNAFQAGDRPASTPAGDTPNRPPAG